MIILAKLLSNALFVIYMSQDPVLSMEPGMLGLHQVREKETLCS